MTDAARLPDKRRPLALAGGAPHIDAMNRAGLILSFCRASRLHAGR